MARGVNDDRDGGPRKQPASGPSPGRVQVRRVKGWRLPANTVYVGRPTRFGNPFRVSEPAGREEAVRRFEEWLHGAPEGASLLAIARAELRGKHLACWCRLDDGPCHADVLLRLVNAA